MKKKPVNKAKSAIAQPRYRTQRQASPKDYSRKGKKKWSLQ